MVLAVRDSALALQIRSTGAGVPAFTDGPGVADVFDTPALLRNAADALTHAPAVIGPAQGGYWRLGLARWPALIAP